MPITIYHFNEEEDSTEASPTGSKGRMSLLALTQNILSAMDSDEVNSIGDTTESLQVADVICETYYEIIGGLTDKKRRASLSMEALSDATYFNQVKIPESVVEIEELWYDIYTDTGYEKRKLRYIEPEQFLKKILANSQTENTIQVETPIFNSSLLPVKTDQDPTCYTTFDEEHLFFDAVNSSYESSIQASRITAWCTYVPDFIREDDFIPDLKIDEFPLLLSEAKSTCFINFKGVSNSKSEQTSRRQRLRQQNNRSRIKTSNKRKIGSTNKVGRRTRRG